MANCNCNDFPISCAPHAPGGDCCHPHGCPPHPHPCPPPPFKGGTSMYIGARYVPIFADPVEWDDEREYEPLTIVIHDGSCYTSKCYVPKGAQLPPYPEGQTKYWVKTSDYNYQFADLKKTVLDLSRLVEQFQKDNKEFTDLINGWNEKVQQWENEMTAWGERLDTVESNITDLTASLNAEIDRAKAAEQANAAAIAQETADRKQAISELDAAYKAADAAEAQARENADNALSDRITANKTDIDALKAEQAIQNTNISNNAKNISDNSAEIAKHAARLTSLESNASDWDSAFPDTTIAQEVQKEELARANADTALNGRCDTIAADVEEVRDIANHKVDQTVFNAADTLNVKYTDTTHTYINTPLLTVDVGWANREGYVLGSSLPNHDRANYLSLGNFSYRSETDAAQNAANKANASIGDWETEHPGKTVAQAVSDNTTAIDGKANKSDIPDVSGFVTETTYNEGQTAQDTKITAAQNAADKANTNIGSWETDHPNQTISECATSLENETAANAAKADANAANIGNWNTEHPGKTIAQEVTRLNGAIPDVSGFVTNTTYTEGQAAQDTKITAAQAAADKANTNIGNWNPEHPGKTISDYTTYFDNVTRTNSDTIGNWIADHPGKTISQAVTDVNYLNLLNEMYPKGRIIPGGYFDSNSIYPVFYNDGSSIGYFNIPAFVPYVVAHFHACWTLDSVFPTSISLYNSAGTIVETKAVTNCRFLDETTNPRLDIGFTTPFTISTPGVYYFKFDPTTRFKYSWTKNNVNFAEFD